MKCAKYFGKAFIFHKNNYSQRRNAPWQKCPLAEMPPEGLTAAYKAVMEMKAENAMDQIDRQILAQLQVNAAQPVADIARKVGLSVTPCWRRIQRMEETGLIRKRVALLDPQKIGVGMSVFVAVRTDQHNAEWLQDFASMVADMPEVVEFYRMSGEVDYLLRVVVPDMAAYDTFYRKLIANVQLTDVSSSFAMEEIKYTTALPLPEIK
jgi:Lrp/AsnC family transcriptional regulator